MCTQFQPLDRVGEFVTRYIQKLCSYIQCRGRVQYFGGCLHCLMRGYGTFRLASKGDGKVSISHSMKVSIFSGGVYLAPVSFSELSE